MLVGMFPRLGTHPELAGSNSPVTILALCFSFFPARSRSFNVQYSIFHSLVAFPYYYGCWIWEPHLSDISFRPDSLAFVANPCHPSSKRPPFLFRGSEPPAALAIVEACSEHLGKSPGDCKSPPTLPSICRTVCFSSLGSIRLQRAEDAAQVSTRVLCISNWKAKPQQPYLSWTNKA